MTINNLFEQVYIMYALIDYALKEQEKQVET